MNLNAKGTLTINLIKQTEKLNKKLNIISTLCEQHYAQWIRELASTSAPQKTEEFIVLYNKTKEHINVATRVYNEIKIDINSPDVLKLFDEFGNMVESAKRKTNLLADLLEKEISGSENQ